MRIGGGLRREERGVYGGQGVCTLLRMDRWSLRVEMHRGSWFSKKMARGCRLWDGRSRSGDRAAAAADTSLSTVGVCASLAAFVCAALSENELWVCRSR